MILPKGALEANAKRAAEEQKLKKLLIPAAFLTALQKRGQDGKPVLRGRESAKGK